MVGLGRQALVGFGKYWYVLIGIGEDCDRNSTDWYNPGIDIWGSSDYLDNFFLRPADPEAYDPNS